eukprot:TRINITY_DN63573_c0_g1_i1.p1 TRINITY_DN63573_c0_g1~~TRINITY_DN63573_c0_g1_i1.p1  ORF type:complete len:605 (+),score=144.02 TRINITY_DN63573_c0_g1_i1:43-1857(+)
MGRARQARHGAAAEGISQYKLHVAGLMYIGALLFFWMHQDAILGSFSAGGDSGIAGFATPVRESLSPLASKATAAASAALPQQPAVASSSAQVAGAAATSDEIKEVQRYLELRGQLLRSAPSDEQLLQLDLQARGHTPCAREGSTCSCAELGSVWYGADGLWTQRPAHASIASEAEADDFARKGLQSLDERFDVECNSGTFGDPAPNKPKSCFCLPAGAIQDPAWVLRPSFAALAAAVRRQIVTIAPLDIAMRTLSGWAEKAQKSVDARMKWAQSEAKAAQAKGIGKGANVVVGLAHLKGIEFGYDYRFFINSLRAADPEVRIILGVAADMAREGTPAWALAQKNQVVLKTVNAAPCDASVTGKQEGYAIRTVCVEGYPRLKMEWARFALFRNWIAECEGCTGWALLTDVRDTFFQRAPFANIGEPPEAPNKDVFLIEEWNNFNSHWFSSASLDSCYGRDTLQPRDKKPMLCSGTLVGAREGILEVLDLLVNEFLSDVEKGPQCQPPRCVDQPVLNYMYYEGKLGPRTTVFKYGEGNVATVGTPCSRNVDGVNKHSLRDVVVLDKDDNILLADGSPAPVVHQYDRCHDWVMPIIAKRMRQKGFK